MPLNAPGRFRALLNEPGFIMALGVWDAYTARVSETLGMQALHLGGYQLGVGNVTSEPLITLSELAHATRMITAAVDIPLIVDAGAGHGEPLHVMRTVKEIERAGAAGLHIEDQIYPKRVHYHQGIEHVVSREELVMKIKAALAARRNPDFAIIGRTDTMATSGFAEGVARANLMLEAGADMAMVFPNTLEEAHLAIREIDGPVVFVNSEGNRLGRPVFSIQEMSDMGLKMATNPTALLCPATQAIKRVLTNLKTTGRSGMAHEDMMVWRKECETLIGLDAMYKIERETVER